MLVIAFVHHFCLFEVKPSNFKNDENNLCNSQKDNIYSEQTIGEKKIPHQPKDQSNWSPDEESLLTLSQYLSVMTKKPKVDVSRTVIDEYLSD